MQFDSSTTALVLTDPQNDFLSPDGVTWELVGKSVEKNHTVDHIEQLLVPAKSGGYGVFRVPALLLSARSSMGIRRDTREEDA